jgi:hypothetical protein
MYSENLTNNTFNQSGVAITERTQGSLTGNPGPPNTIVFNSVDGLSGRAPHEGSATPVTAAPNRLVAALAAGQSPRATAP